MNLKNLLVTALLASAVQASAEKTITLTSDNTITINGPVSSEITTKVLEAAKELDARVPVNEPIYLVLNTPGGYVDDGVEAIELLRGLKRPVHTITIFSASMGFHMVQGLSKRYILRDGTLMSHKASGSFSGEFPGQLDSRYLYYLKRIGKLDERVVARTDKKYTLKQYRTLIENEYWCDGEDCVKAKFADAVVRAECDQSLKGRRVEAQKIILMGHAAVLQFEFSKCPLITGLLDVNVFVDGKSVFKAAPNALSESVYISPDDKLLIEKEIKKRVSREVIKSY